MGRVLPCLRTSFLPTGLVKPNCDFTITLEAASSVWLSPAAPDQLCPPGHTSCFSVPNTEALSQSWALVHSTLPPGNLSPPLSPTPPALWAQASTYFDSTLSTLRHTLTTAILYKGSFGCFSHGSINYRSEITYACAAGFFCPRLSPTRTWACKKGPSPLLVPP